MAVKTFKWKVERAVAPTIAFRVNTAQFGDGYKQESSDGVNNKDESYNFTANYREKDAKELIDFLDEHAGVRAFLWTPPLRPVGLYKCKDYAPVAQGGGLYVITGTFERAYSSTGV